jgi:hypothetical protein
VIVFCLDKKVVKQVEKLFRGRLPFLLRGRHHATLLPGHSGSLAGDLHVRLTMLVPWLLSWATHDGAESAFDEAFLLTVGTGLGLWYATRKEKRDLTIRDGFLMVALVWTVLAGLCRPASNDPAQCEFYRCLF